MSSSTARAIRRDFTLADAWREFWKHASPWMFGATLVVALAARMVVGDWQITDALVPVVMVALFPFFEWMVHVFIMHWWPRRIGGLTIDPFLARIHRQHHADPGSVTFIPFQVLPGLFGAPVAIALSAFPRLGLGLAYLVTFAALGLGYEWTHYLIHTDYKPRTPVYRAIWRNHRLHHFKNEHYWFTVTSFGTADRVLRTHPDPATVPTSPTAKNPHASPGIDAPQGGQHKERLRQNWGERRRNRLRGRRPRNRGQRFAFRVCAALRARLRKHDRASS